MDELTKRVLSLFSDLSSVVTCLDGLDSDQREEFLGSLSVEDYFMLADLVKEWRFYRG